MFEDEYTRRIQDKINTAKQTQYQERLNGLSGYSYLIEIQALEYALSIYRTLIARNVL